MGSQLGDAGFSRIVAIKRLHAHLVHEPEFITMLVDEARLASKIHHPNVVSPIDVVAQGGEVFIVMNYVPGASLSALVRSSSTTGEPFSLPGCVRVMLDALEGLHAAHEAADEDGCKLQIIHRDVSPQNILVGQEGVAKLIDFGIAKATVRWQTTQAGQVKGKLPYMAPEQLRDQTVDRRADVYAAAVVLWELVARRRLFQATSDAALYGKVLEGVVHPPSRYNPAVPSELDAVIVRALSREPDERPATAREFARSLEQALAPATADEVAAWLARTVPAELALQRANIAQVTAASRVVSEEPPAPALAVTLEPPKKEARNSRKLAGWAAAAFAILVVVAWRGLTRPGALPEPGSVASTSTLGGGAKNAPAPPSTAAAPDLAAPPEAKVPVSVVSSPAATTKRSQAKTKAGPRPQGKRPDCSTLYTTGADGIRHVKRECL